ncbi:MAG: hypothetical protein ACJAU0_001098 [Flavobacteriales bacterium]|jgi:hypothetical protein
MREEAKSPIAMWLSGTYTANPFGSTSVAFKIRREMANSAGKLQAGMFSVFAQEALHQFDVNSGNESIIIGSLVTEIFDLPAAGEQVYAHINTTPNKTSVNMYNADQHLIARTILT